MLSSAQQKFCEAFASGMNGTEAYQASHPSAARSTAKVKASQSLALPEVKTEIQRLRTLAQEKGGSAVMTILEKRMFLARVVRAQIALLDEDSDLWQRVKRTRSSVEYRLPDKLAAIMQ